MGSGIVVHQLDRPLERLGEQLVRTFDVAVVVKGDPASEQRVRRAGVCPSGSARFRGGKAARRSLDPSPTARVGAGDGEADEAGEADHVGEADEAGPDRSKRLFHRVGVSSRTPVLLDAPPS